MPFVLAAFIGLLLLAGPSHAAERPPEATEQVAESVTRWETAQALLRAGRQRAALPHLERLVSRYPADPRLRLALATTLFEIEDDERASFHFEQALAGPLPPEVRDRVGAFLDRIRARKTWQAGFSLALAPESNVARRTTAETVSIGGLRFTLNPDARAKSGTGLHLGGSAAYLHRLSRDLRLRLAAAGSARLFRESAFNDIAIRTEAGLLHLRDGGTEWGAGIALQRRWLGGGGFSRGHGAFLTYDRRLNPVTRVSLRTDLEAMRHDRHPDLDGPRLRLAAALAHVRTPQLSLRGRVFATRIFASADHERGTEHGLTLGATYAFRGGLIAGVDATVAHGEREGPPPLFAQARRETRYEVAASLLHRSLRIAGFAPTLELAHEVRRANIALYEYETTRLSLGVSRRF